MLELILEKFSSEQSTLMHILDYDLYDLYWPIIIAASSAQLLGPAPPLYEAEPLLILKPSVSIDCLQPMLQYPLSLLSKKKYALKSAWLRFSRALKFAKFNVLIGLANKF